MTTITNSRLITVDQANNWEYKIKESIEFTGTNISDATIKKAISLKSIIDAKVEEIKKLTDKLQHSKDLLNIAIIHFNTHLNVNKLTAK